LSIREIFHTLMLLLNCNLSWFLF